MSCSFLVPCVFKSRIHLRRAVCLKKPRLLITCVGHVRRVPFIATTTSSLESSTAVTCARPGGGDAARVGAGSKPSVCVAVSCVPVCAVSGDRKFLLQSKACFSLLAGRGRREFLTKEGLAQLAGLEERSLIPNQEVCFMLLLILQHSPGG